MDRLLTVADIAARYGCCTATARARMRQMVHIETPRLMVSESAVKAWETSRTIVPGDKVRNTKKRKTDGFQRFEWIPGVSKIPRTM